MGSFPSLNKSDFHYGRMVRESSFQISPVPLGEPIRNPVASPLTALMAPTERAGPVSLFLQGYTQLWPLHVIAALSSQCVSCLSVGLSFPNILAYIHTDSHSKISRHATVLKLGNLVSANTDHPIHSCQSTFFYF